MIKIIVEFSRDFLPEKCIKITFFVTDEICNTVIVTIIEKKYHNDNGVCNNYFPDNLPCL